MTGQVRRQPPPRPPPGEQWTPRMPHVTGGTQAVQQQQNRLPAAALVNPQASSHTPQCAIALSPRRTPDPGRPDTARQAAWHSGGSAGPGPPAMCHAFTTGNA
jgi:hypothetical protein